MLRITPSLSIPDEEIELHAMRAQGAGGQNVNKVETAVQLRFSIRNSSIPEVFKQKLLALHDRRISRDGVIVIRAQRYRSQEQNRIDALERLQLLLRKAAEPVKCRRVTVPSGKSKEKRLETKTRRGHIKKLRRKAWEKEDG